jgi:hypothetical protein
MRKVGSLEAQEEAKKRNIMVISIFILVIMVFGTVGFAFSSYSGEERDSIGVDEDRVIEVGGEKFYLGNSVGDVENISVEVYLSTWDYSGGKLYIDSENQAVFQEIQFTLGRIADRVQGACYGECERNLPEKNCTSNLIIWKDSPENKVYQEENCVFIEGDLRAVDAFIYKVFGKI